MSCARLFTLLCFLAACAFADPARHEGAAPNYAKIRGRVANAMPEKAYELAETLALLHQLSQESAKLLVKLEANCLHK